MKKKILIGMLIGSIMILIISLMTLGINKLGRMSSTFTETWNAQECFGNYIENLKHLKIEKAKDFVIISNNDDIVCDFKFRGNTGPYYCESVSDWVITFNKSFDALVIEEYDNDMDVGDGIYFGPPNYYLFTLDNDQLSKSYAIDLIEKILGKEIVYLP